jgi:hypothetical protein
MNKIENIAEKEDDDDIDYLNFLTNFNNHSYEGEISSQIAKKQENIVKELDKSNNSTQNEEEDEKYLNYIDSLKSVSLQKPICTENQSYYCIKNIDDDVDLIDELKSEYENDEFDEDDEEEEENEEEEKEKEVVEINLDDLDECYVEEDEKKKILIIKKKKSGDAELKEKVMLSTLFSFDQMVCNGGVSCPTAGECIKRATIMSTISTRKFIWGENSECTTSKERRTKYENVILII